MLIKRHCPPKNNNNSLGLIAAHTKSNIQVCHKWLSHIWGFKNKNMYTLPNACRVTATMYLLYNKICFKSRSGDCHVNKTITDTPTER